MIRILSKSWKPFLAIQAGEVVGFIVERFFWTGIYYPLRQPANNPAATCKLFEKIYECQLKYQSFQFGAIMGAAIAALFCYLIYCGTSQTVQKRAILGLAFGLFYGFVGGGFVYPTIKNGGRPPPLYPVQSGLTAMYDTEHRAFEALSGASWGILFGSFLGFLCGLGYHLFKTHRSQISPVGETES